MKILTGIDLPFSPSCGSMIFCNDLYSTLSDTDEIRFLSLKNPQYPAAWSMLPEIRLLDLQKKAISDEGYIKSLGKAISEEIASFKPEIIHIQHLTYGMAHVLSDIRCNIPKIAICHGTDIQIALQDPRHKDLVLKTCSAAARIIFPTEMLYRSFEQSISSRFFSKVEVIPLGIPEIPLKIKETKQKDSFSIVFAGRLTPDKGADLIIESLNLLPSSVNLTIIGSGPEEAFLKDLVKKYALSQRVSFLDFLPRELLWEKLTGFDALIIPSMDIEAFCLIAVEAQAIGLPVIYARTSGLINVIGDTGMSFEPQDLKSLAGAVAVLSGNPGLRRSYSKLGFDNAGRYSLSRSAQSFRTLSETVLK